MLLTAKSETCELPKEITKLKLISVLATTAFLFGVSMIITFIDFIPIFTGHQLKLAKGSLIHQILEKSEVESTYFQVYIFNYTNLDRFISGEDYKLKVEDIGPFNYRELRRHENVEFYPEREIMGYNPRFRLVQHPEMPGLQPEETKVTSINGPMLIIASFATASPLTRIAYNTYTSWVKSKPIINVNADEYLMGYQEPMMSVAHTMFPGLLPTDEMGIFMWLYDNKEFRLELSTNDLTKFMIKSRNGHKKLQLAEYVDPDNCVKCASFENTYEGVGFPIGAITPEFKFSIFKNGLCKTIEFEYHERKKMFYGGEALVYNMSDNFFRTDPAQPSNGMTILSECYFGMAVSLSKPHFADVDPQTYERLEGINPEKGAFRSWMAIDPKLGVSVGVEASAQANIVLGDLSFHTKTKPFSNMVLPLMYIKLEQPPLMEEVMAKINTLYNIAPIVIQTAQILIYCLTLMSFLYFIRLLYLTYTFEREVTTRIVLENTPKTQSKILTTEEFWLLEKCGVQS